MKTRTVNGIKYDVENVAEYKPHRRYSRAAGQPPRVPCPVCREAFVFLWMFFETYKLDGQGISYNVYKDKHTVVACCSKECVDLYLLMPILYES